MYINIYIYKIMYAYVHIFVLSIFMLLLGFNNYLYFLLMIEVTTVYFMIIIIVNYSNYSFVCINNMYNMCIFTILISLLIITNIYIYNYNINYNTLYITYSKYSHIYVDTNLHGIFFIFFNTINYYCIIVGMSFIVITHIIIYIIRSLSNIKIFSNIYKITNFIKNIKYINNFYEKKYNYNIVYNNLLNYFK
jgi:hypothetical protein